MPKTKNNNWSDCKRILCVRADNMGDLIMTTPAIRALKQSFDCSITVLTSKMGQLAVPFIPGVDDVIVFDLPWVKSNTDADEGQLLSLIENIRNRRFDAAIIFTVYSQSALPAALLLMLAGIPKRLAWCRENPYGLLTDWMPDKEPYKKILHQVERDLLLVAGTGAITDDDRLCLQIKSKERYNARARLQTAGVDADKPFLVFHPGVSEEKRRYPTGHWIDAGKMAVASFGCPVLVTGTANEKSITNMISKGIGDAAIDMAGLLTIGELMAVIGLAFLIVSVNTSTVHIAAAMQTPVVVLYALTNPQHTPWKVLSRILPFSVPEKLKSRNEIIRWVDQEHYRNNVPFPEPSVILQAMKEISAGATVNRHEAC